MAEECYGLGEHAAHDYETIFFMCISILAGTVLLHLQTLPAFHRLQFTVVLFVLGMILAVVIETYLDEGWSLQRSYNSWMEVDPHLLLFTFLPPLLCGDAINMDTHLAKRTFGQCLFLAGPGVMIATDPVAVVGLLKELGASPVLTLQIQGESLLNDGTAMVLFFIAYGITGAEEWGILKMIVFAMKSILVAPFLGTVFGILFYLWIRVACDKLSDNSSLIQISLTISCAYISFFVAESIYDISGVLTTVTAAFVLADNMWTILVSPESMRNFWHVVEVVGNSLVFIVAGAMTGKAALNSRPADWIWLMFIYVAVTVIRFVMFLGLRPLLNCLGTHVSLSDVLLMTWGGLRGIVGLALAILVRKDLAGGHLSGIDDDRILFIVGGTTALTLLVNATTCPRLVDALGLARAPLGRNALIRSVALRGRENVEGLIDNLMCSSLARKNLIDPGIVKDMVDQVNQAVITQLPRATRLSSIRKDERAKMISSPSLMMNSPSRQFRMSIFSGNSSIEAPKKSRTEQLWEDFTEVRHEVIRCNAIIPVFKFASQLQDIKSLLDTCTMDPSHLKIVREVFLRTVHCAYWEQVESGKFKPGSSEPTLLLGSVRVAGEECASHLADWQALENDIRFAEMVSDDLLQKVASTQLANSNRSRSIQRYMHNWRLAKSLADQKRAVHIISSFTEAHSHAQSQIAAYFGEDLSSPEQAFVIMESQIEVLKAACKAGLIDKALTKYENNMMECRRIVGHFYSFVLSAHHSGVLLAKEAEVLLQPIVSTLQDIDKDPKWARQTLANTISPFGAALKIQGAWRRYKTMQHLRQSIGITTLSDDDGNTIFIDGELTDYDVNTHFERMGLPSPPRSFPSINPSINLQCESCSEPKSSSATASIQCKEVESKCPAKLVSPNKFEVLDSQAEP